MKNFVLLSFLIFSLFFSGCGPVDVFGVSHTLENTEFSLEPDKEVYSLSDTISLEHSFMLDSEKFYKYECYITVYFSDIQSEALYDHILIYDELGDNITNKKLSYSISENTKITKKFTLIPRKKGNYAIFFTGTALTRKYDNDDYESRKVYYLNIK